MKKSTKKGMTTSPWMPPQMPMYNPKGKHMMGTGGQANPNKPACVYPKRAN